MHQDVTAKLRYLRMSPRKVRLVADMIRGRSVARAVDILSVANKRPAKPLLKLVLSAVANAKHNFAMSDKALKVATITVDGGPMLKRWMPKAHGRATPVRERTSHINVVLSGEKMEEKKEAETSEEVQVVAKTAAPKKKVSAKKPRS